MAEQEGKQETPKENWADTIEVRDAPEMDSPDSKILNQEEIDSLLGYSNDEEEDYRPQKPAFGLF